MLRIHPDEKALIKKAAWNLSMSAWIREVAVAAAPGRIRVKEADSKKWLAKQASKKGGAR